MLPVNVYPDAEKAIIDYLAPLIADDATYDDVPLDVRGGGGRFVRVRRIGGIALTPNHDHPWLDVMVWHDSDKHRMALTQRLWAWLRAANNDPAGDAVIGYVSTVLGPRQMPDPADDTKTVCMFTVAMYVRN